MNKTDKLEAPVAKKILKELVIHGDTRLDPYYWLNERDNPEVIAYLNAENAYYEQQTAHYEDFKEALFIEMKSRIKEDDQSVPYKYNGYWYITKYVKGKDYPIYSRKKESLDNPEELLFDCNEMAKAHSYFRLVGLTISPDNKRVAYGIDTSGRRNYTIYIKDLETNTVLEDSIENTTGSSAWANDNNTLFYVKKHETTLRPYQIYRHTIGKKEDVLVYEEQDNTFGIAVYKSKSKKFLIIACYSTTTNEYHILNANEPQGVFKVFQERIKGLEYSISHYNDHFYIVTNKDDATNFKLMKTKDDCCTIDHWEEVLPHRADTLIEHIDIFKDFLVVSERTNGLNQLRVMRWDNSTDYYLPFNDETYTAFTGTNVEFDTHLLRFGYNSLTTPSSVIEFNMQTKTQRILKEQEVLGGKFDKNNYMSERLWAVAEDGTKIPMSLVHRKDVKKSKQNPV
ncbi:MAG: S9 family peptidase, partial [Winogradskyella sp.]|nr:S9 family peptidase [Winogradskyella sp.]